MVRSDAGWMSKDDKKSIVRFQRFLHYAPKIILPLTLASLHKPLTMKKKAEMDESTEKLLSTSHPARCTSAQYLDRNGNPLLYYFGRRLVRAEDKKVSLPIVPPLRSPPIVFVRTS